MEGICFWAIYVKNRITKSVVQWPIIVLHGVHVISVVVSCMPAFLQEVMRKLSPCLPGSILQAQKEDRHTKASNDILNMDHSRRVSS